MLNRRTFLASVIALAVAPKVKAEPIRKVDMRCHYKSALMPCEFFKSALDADLKSLNRQVNSGAPVRFGGFRNLKF